MNIDKYKSIDNWLWWIFSLMAFAVCVSRILGRNLFWILLFFIMVKTVRQPSFLAPLNKIRGLTKAGLCILGVVVFSTVYGGNITALYKSRDIVYQLSIVLLFVPCLLVKTRAQLQRILDMMVAGFLVAGLHILWQIVTHAAIVGDYRPVSLIGGNMVTATLYNCVLPLTFIKGLDEQNQLRKKSYLGVFSLYLSIMLMAGSRGTYVAMGLVLGGICCYHWRHGWKKIIIAVIALGVLCCVIVTAFPRVGKRMKSMMDVKGESQWVRVEIWKGAFSMWQDYPLLGVGAGNYEKYYVEKYHGYKKEWSEGRNKLLAEYPHAHNLCLQLLAESGLVGFVIYAGSFGYLLYWGWKRRLDSNGLLVFFTTAAILIYSQFEHVVFGAWAGMRLYWLLMGLMVRAVLLKEDLEERRE